MGPPLAGTLDNVRGKAEHFVDIFSLHIWMILSLQNGLLDQSNGATLG